MFKGVTAPAAGALAAGLMLAAPAGADTVHRLLDFSGDICGPFTAFACGSGQRIGQAYGDIPNLLDVVYDANSESPNDSSALYGGDYGVLEHVALAVFIDYTFTIRFVPLNGATVTLESFDLASRLRSEFSSTSIEITDEADGSVL